MNKNNLMFGKNYSSIRIIPMHDDVNEMRVKGQDSIIVKNYFFDNEIKNGKNYYYHGKMIDIRNSEPVLALFQYQNEIIAYGRIVKRTKASEPGYVKPKDDNYPYDGLIVVNDTFKVDVINNNELNDVLKKPIKFSNALHILDVELDKFQALLFRKTKL